MPRRRRGAKAVAAERRVEIALELGRLGRPHPKVDERGAVAFAQEARAVGDVGRGGDRAGALDA